MGFRLLEIDLEHSFQYELYLKQVIDRINVELVEQAIGHVIGNGIVLYEYIGYKEASVHGRVNAQSLLKKVKGVREELNHIGARKRLDIGPQLLHRKISVQNQVVLQRIPTDPKVLVLSNKRFDSNSLLFAQSIDCRICISVGCLNGQKKVLYLQNHGLVVFQDVLDRVQVEERIYNVQVERILQLLEDM